MAKLDYSAPFFKFSLFRLLQQEQAEDAQFRVIKVNISAALQTRLPEQLFFLILLMDARELQHLQMTAVFLLAIMFPSQI